LIEFIVFLLSREVMDFGFSRHGPRFPAAWRVRDAAIELCIVRIGAFRRRIHRTGRALRAAGADGANSQSGANVEVNLASAQQCAGPPRKYAGGVIFSERGQG
jgi:hypothetical protein